MTNKASGPGKGNGGGSKRTAFQPGQSGNPGGRPKWLTAVQRAAQEKCPEAIETLAAIMHAEDAPAAARVSAATAILDRGLGKPRQAVEVTGADGGPIATMDYSALTEEEILTALAIQRKARAVAIAEGHDDDT